MTVWRQYDIGKGQKYSFKDIGLNANTCVPAITTLSMSDLQVKQLKQKPLQHVQEGESQQAQQDVIPQRYRLKMLAIFFLVLRMDAFALSSILVTCCDILTLETTHFLSKMLT